MTNTYKTLRFCGYKITAEIIDADTLAAWTCWAAGNRERLNPLDQAYDPCHLDDIYDVYEVNPDDYAPLGGCTGYIAVKWTFDD